MRRHIMLVEDDLAVREVISRVLGSAGFGVVQATTVETALELLERSEGDIVLVLTDVRLEGGSGHDLARQVRERWPSLPLCLLSGQPDRRQVPRPEPDRGYVEKPPLVPALLAEVERLIGDARR
jgi:DNA-binding NtrC family response regulator